MKNVSCGKSTGCFEVQSHFQILPLPQLLAPLNRVTRVVVEISTTTRFHTIFHAQIINYDVTLASYPSHQEARSDCSLLVIWKGP